MMRTLIWREQQKTEMIETLQKNAKKHVHFPFYKQIKIYTLLQMVSKIIIFMWFFIADRQKPYGSFSFVVLREAHRFPKVVPEHNLEI